VILALPLLLPVLAAARFWWQGGAVTVSRARLHLHSQGRCRSYAVPKMCETHNTWVCTRSHGGGGPLAGCRIYVNNLGYALEVYGHDHGGRYPTSLTELTPRYLKGQLHCPSEVPGCPASTGYLLEVNASQDRFTLVCSGHKHAGVGENYPQYTSLAGPR
jgi:hypothetical protein